jgi:glycosyltransferase involved in cell wall biosynthesis
MTILHILHAARAEGTVKLAVDWLADSHIRQEVVTLSAEPTDLRDELERQAAWFDPGTRIPEGRMKFPWMFMRSWRICRSRKPDMVICWMNGFSPWILSGARLAGVRRLITHAGNPPDRALKGRIMAVFSTFVAWVTGAKMVCCSDYVAAEIARSPGVFKSVLRTVPNCAPIARIRRLAEDSRSRRKEAGIRFIMVATLEGHKDHATLILSMPSVIKAIPDAQLILVGDGSLRPSLEALSVSLGVAASVSFLGSRRDVPLLLGGSDVFVFSTTWQEGLGTVLIEAMAAGLPIVASNVPACSEAVGGGRWGTLVPPADPEALAAAMIASTRELRIADSRSRREYLEKFVPARMIAGYQAVTL